MKIKLQRIIILSFFETKWSFLLLKIDLLLKIPPLLYAFYKTYANSILSYFINISSPHPSSVGRKSSNFIGYSPPPSLQAKGEGRERKRKKERQTDKNVCRQLYPAIPELLYTRHC
jgi:hypothetical protein